MELTPVPPILGPSMRTKLVPRGLPMMVWSIAGAPINPAGGGDSAGSHWRKGPMLEAVRRLAELHAGGTRRHPAWTGRLVVPVSHATNGWTPYGWVTVYVAPGVRPAVTRMRRRANTI